MKIGKIVQDIRRERDMTQEDFGELFHVTRQAVSSWENEKTYPDLITLIEISNMFDISLDIMLKEDKNMTDKLNKDIKRSKLLKKVLPIVVVIAVLVVAFYCMMTKERYVSYEEAGIKIEKNVIKSKEYSIRSYIAPDGEAEFYYLYKTKTDNYQDGRRVLLSLDKDARTSTTETDDGKVIESRTLKEIYYLPKDYAEKMEKASRAGKGFWYKDGKRENKDFVEEVKKNSKLIWRERQ